MRVGRALNEHIVCGRDTVGSAQVLGETFRAFQLRRRGVRTEYRDIRRAQGIGDAGDERRFGTDDDEIDVFVPCARSTTTAMASQGSIVHTFRPARDPGIARRSDQFASSSAIA